jgi:excisionase family DNA binding protein
VSAAVRDLTVRDVATELSVSEQGVRHLLARGHLRGYQVGRRWRVTRAAVDAYKETNSRRAHAPAPSAIARSDWGDLEPLEDNPFA